MIDFRYFLVTIAAVFLAIATGLVLGAGPLSEADQSAAEDAPTNEKLQERLMRTEQRARYAERVATTTGTASVHGRLEGRRVAIVALPGSDTRLVRKLDELLPDTGATVTQTLQVTDKWSDPGQRQFLDDLSADLVTDDVDLPEGNAYDRSATVLANAVFDASSGDPDEGADAASGDRTANKPEDEAEQTADEEDRSARAADAATVLGAYEEANLIRSGEQNDGSAELAIVVAPDPTSEGSDPARRTGSSGDQAWLAMASALDRAGDGTVVAGPATAARASGVLDVVRSNAATASAVSSVDVADRPLGPAVVALALEEQAEGGSGHYGTVGPVDGALPG